MSIHKTASLRGSRAVGLVTVVAVFAAGGLAGAALDRAYGRLSGAAIPTTVRTENGVRRRGANGERTGDEPIPVGLAVVGLTPEQETEVRAIVARLRPTTDSLWHELRPKALAVEVQMFQQSACVFSPTQVEKFKKYMNDAGASAEQVAERLKLVNSSTCPKRVNK